MAYWAVARLEPHRERIALHHLALVGFETYCPRLRERRISHGRKIEVCPLLFPGYAFLAVEAQWYAARWSIGVIGLIMDGVRPARVADQIIDDLRKRERNGLIELPRRDGFKVGDKVRIRAGPFTGHLAIFTDMKPHQRCEILLALLGGEQRVELPRESIEVAAP
jgi:transcription antitermination factor NusG